MIKRKITSALLSMLLTAYAAALIIFSKDVTSDVNNALMRCVNVIIPSLFAFMAISDLMIRSGAYIFISKLFAPLAYIIKLPTELIFAFLLGNTAGYPVGSSVICSLFDENRLDKKSASRLLCTCYNGGPAFFSGAVGLAVFSSSRVGMIIFFSIFLSNIAAAAILNRLFPIKYEHSKGKTVFKSEMISDSVSSAGIGIFKICGMILVFQTLLTVLGKCIPTERISDQNLRITADSFLEISNLSALSGLPYRLLPFIAAAGAFGGVCVIMQIHTIVGKRFSIAPFIFARILCSALSAVFCILMNRIFGIKYLDASVQPHFIVNFNNFIPSVCLIMMIFLTVLRKRLAFSK